jgi:hypothetical protein
MDYEKNVNIFNKLTSPVDTFIFTIDTADIMCNCSLMDDLRFRKIFNLGKKLSKLEKLQSLVAKSVVKYGKYSPAKLANLYTFLLRAEVGN